LLGLNGEQTHQVKMIGMIGICREPAPAADLRIQISPGLQMAKAHLMERRRGVWAGALGSFLRFPGSYSAFATAHRHISKWLCQSGLMANL
jgi:hypothetical protein